MNRKHRKHRKHHKDRKQMNRSWCAVIVAGAFLMPAGASSSAHAQLPPDMPAKPGFPTNPLQPGHRSAENLASMRVLADVGAIEPEETFHLVVVFTIAEDWHLYWKNPGAGAAAPRFQVTAPRGFEVGEVRWPRPTLLKTETGDMYAYESEVAFFIPITPPSDPPGGGVAFHVSANWAVCDEKRCHLGNAKQSLLISTTGPAGTPSAADAALVKEHSKRLPRSADDDDASVTISRSNGIITISGPADGSGRLTFFPNSSAGVTLTQKQVTFADGRFTVEILVEQDLANYVGERPTAAGLIALGTRATDPAYEFSVPLDEER